MEIGAAVMALVRTHSVSGGEGGGIRSISKIGIMCRVLSM